MCGILHATGSGIAHVACRLVLAIVVCVRIHPARPANSVQRAQPKPGVNLQAHELFASHMQAADLPLSLARRLEMDWRRGLSNAECHCNCKTDEVPHLSRISDPAPHVESSALGRRPLHDQETWPIAARKKHWLFLVFTICFEQCTVCRVRGGSSRIHTV